MGGKRQLGLATHPAAWSVASPCGNNVKRMLAKSKKKKREKKGVH